MLTEPLLVLLLFVLWTIAILIFGIGGARAYRVARGERFCDFPGGVAEGPPFHARAVRAHLNCVENLPIYGAVALTAAYAQVTGWSMDLCAWIFLAARIGQSSVHLALPQTEPVVRIRGLLFGVQVIAVAWMAIVILTAAG